MGKIGLPTKKHIAEAGWPDVATWLIYGPPKVGKTELLAQWPECLILNTEPRGARYVDGAYVMDIEGLAHLRELFLELRAKLPKGELPYKTIGIDTLDEVVSWTYEEVVKELGIGAMGEGSHGGEWRRGVEKTESIITQFGSLPINMVFTAHSKPDKLGDKVVGTTLDLAGMLPRAVMGRVENLLLCSFDKTGNRKLVLRPSATQNAGSHNPVLARAQTCDLSYKALRGLFKEGANADSK